MKKETKKDLKKLATKLLSLTKKEVDGGCDVLVGSGLETDIEFEQNKLKLIKTSQNNILDLRVINKGRFGVSATNNTSSDEILRIVEDAKTVSKFGKSAKGVKLPLPSKISEPQLFDKNLEKLDKDYFIGLGEKVIRLVLEKEPEMIVNYLGFSKSIGRDFFINSPQVESFQRQSHIRFDIEFSRIKEGDFFQLYTGQSSRRDDLDVIGLTEGLLEKASWGKKIAKIKSGKYPVIFTPESAEVIIDYLLTATNGKFVNEKTSKLSESLGKKLFDERLTVIDDPTVDWGMASFGVDDEGVGARKKHLIKGGSVENFYYDLAQAAKAGCESTGNGVRRPFVQADPGVSNVIVSAGVNKYKNLISKIKEGLLVYQFIGAGMNNPFNGDFQLNINLGFYVKNGEIVGRLKDVAIAGNVFDLLRNNLMWLSAETERWDNLTSPYICLGSVVVTAR